MRYTIMHKTYQCPRSRNTYVIKTVPQNNGSSQVHGDGFIARTNVQLYLGEIWTMKKTEVQFPTAALYLHLCNNMQH